jgi:FkbM family methyltransferase
MKVQIQRLFARLGLHVSRNPLSYYDLVAEIKESLILQSKGVLHIGAHRGLEAPFYSNLQRNVMWIEAIPSIFDDLSINIAHFENQSAHLALLGEEDNAAKKMYLSSNDYMSSSVFQFGEDMNHKNLSMKDEITLPMKRLDSLFNSQDLFDYKHWVIDVQGSEIQVLNGAGELLKNVNSMEIEVSTKSEYECGATWKPVSALLKDFGLFPLWEPKENSHEDILFVRRF